MMLLKRGGSIFWHLERLNCFGKDISSVYRINNPATLQDIIQCVEEKGSFGDLTEVHDWRFCLE